MVKGTNMPAYKEEKIRVYFFAEGEDNKQNIGGASGYYIYNYSTPIGYNEQYQVLVNTSNNTWFNTTTGIFQDNNLQVENFQDDCLSENQMLNQYNIPHGTEFKLSNNKTIKLINSLPNYKDINTFITYNDNQIGQLFNAIFHYKSTVPDSSFYDGLDTAFHAYKVYSNCIIFIVSKPEVRVDSGSGFFEHEPRIMTVAIIFE